MLTFFTIPKKFEGHTGAIQRNAIQSWMQLSPPNQIILFGTDAGVQETAQEFGVVHIPEIEKNEFGTPLLHSAFSLAQKRATHDLLVYINTDIITFSDFVPAIRKIPYPMFLAAGRRWNLEVDTPIDFTDAHWEEKLKERMKKEGVLFGFSGIDYFVFPKTFPHELPAFAVGRRGWDNWLLYHTRRLNIPVIDATEMILIIHQNHNYSHYKNGQKLKGGGPEADRNTKLAGGLVNMLTLREANWMLTPSGLEKLPFPRRFFSLVALWYPWRMLLALKRRIRMVV